MLITDNKTYKTNTHQSLLQNKHLLQSYFLVYGWQNHSLYILCLVLQCPRYPGKNIYKSCKNKPATEKIMKIHACLSCKYKPYST